MNTAVKEQSFYQHNLTVTGYLAIYLIAVYFQGAFQAIVDSQMYLNNEFVRNPDVPLWVKMTDEVLLFLGLIFFLLTRFKIKDLFSDTALLVLTTITLSYLGLKYHFLGDGVTDLLGISVLKTLISTFVLIYLILGGYLKGALNFRFIQFLHRILIVTLLTGLFIYFWYPYQVYGNRLIGLSLNPNFNGMHSLFLVLLFYSHRIGKKEEVITGIVASLCLIYSCSITADIMMVVQIAAFGLFCLLFSKSYLNNYFKKSRTLLICFAFSSAFILFFSPKVIFEDYASKFKGVASYLNVKTPSEAVEKVASENDLPNLEGRIETAKLVYSDIRLTYTARNSRYLQSDSSWLNLIYNFGIGGFLLIVSLLLLSFTRLYFRAGSRKFVAALQEPLFAMMLIFAFNFLVVGCFFQQYLENWNTSLLLVAAIGYLYWRTSSIEVSVN